jgi:hypothetical protein
VNSRWPGTARIGYDALKQIHALDTEILVHARTSTLPELDG